MKVGQREFHVFKRNGWRECVMTAAGILVGVGGVALLAFLTDMPFIIASFGSSAVLLYCANQSPLAQPRNFLCSHFIAALISITIVNLLGDGWYVGALCVLATVLAMMFTDTVHPPAGATALLIALQGTTDYAFLLCPLLPGVAIMFAAALLSARIFPGVRPYPARK